MGDSHCSKIAIMQLFHELKQQFPALPDHIISQCIAQNSYNRQTCEQSLRETQDLRPPLGTFPPVLSVMPTRCIANHTVPKSEKQVRRHRPASLDIQKASDLVFSSYDFSIPLSEPPLSADAVDQRSPWDGEPVLVSNKSESECSRSYTSVSLILRPPSLEPQIPIEISSQGSSLTYSTSSTDPRGFQSRLQICIGSSNPTSVTAARIKHPMNLIRPNTLTSLVQNAVQKPPGLPTGLLNQTVKPAKTMSAPTTPSNPPKTTTVVNSGSLPTTPTTISEPDSALSCSMRNQLQVSTESEKQCSSSKVLPEYQKQHIIKQLIKKDRLAEALKAEKEKLEAMKKEIRSLSEPEATGVRLTDLKQKLQGNIYQLQLECDRLTKEIDLRSEQKVPLGETNEEFYRSIYTGQKIKRNASRAPPIPSRPPVWQSRDVAGASAAGPGILDDEREEGLGPPWICSMCTFANHPLINACEQCNMLRFNCVNKPGETKDIRIRVTHRQSFPPRRTEHSWVV